jgi:hypothetical protein
MEDDENKKVIESGYEKSSEEHFHIENQPPRPLGTPPSGARRGYFIFIFTLQLE